MLHYDKEAKRFRQRDVSKTMAELGSRTSEHKKQTSAANGRTGAKKTRGRTDSEKTRERKRTGQAVRRARERGENDHSGNAGGSAEGH